MNSLTIFCEHANINTVENLHKIIDYVKSNHLKFIRLNQIEDFFNDKLGGNWALLTFDDGQESLYPDIAPLLRANKIQAISFVVPVQSDFHKLYTDFVYYIKNSDVFELGSHTMTHTKVINSMEYDDTQITSPKLLYYGDKPQVAMGYGLISREFNRFKGRLETKREYEKRITIEIEYSKEWIERATGRSCRFFAYPFGIYSNKVAAIVRNAGYKMAFTVNKTNGTLFTIPRLLTEKIKAKDCSIVIEQVCINYKT